MFPACWILQPAQCNRSKEILFIRYEIFTCKNIEENENFIFFLIGKSSCMLLVNYYKDA